jgi:hypothetical protein
MKQAPVEHENVEPAATKPEAGAAPSYVMVYSFVVWDHDRAATIIYPRMATPAAIAKMRGKVNEDTAWVVAASELDIEGFYSPAGTRNGT